MTNPLSEFEVERMPDKSWERIEDAVFEGLDNEVTLPAFDAFVPPVRRRWLPMLGFGTLAAAATAIALFTFGNNAPVAPGTPEPTASSRVVTAGDSSLVSLDGADLDVAPESALVMSGDDERGMLVVLERGSVDCTVQPREGRPPFVVRAGSVQIRVVGTRFVVARDGDSAVVEVTKGTVEIIADGERTLVNAGEVWWQPIDDDAELGAEPATAAAAPVARKKRKRRKRRRKAVVAKRESAPAIAVAPVGPTRAARYNTAARLEASDPASAIASYRALARGSDTWASLALFAHARLQADRGNTKRARKLLDQYLERFPYGPNAADARALRGASN